jgi:sRNA-binding carbon storage regulator CsrA
MDVKTRGRLVVGRRERERIRLTSATGEEIIVELVRVDWRRRDVRILIDAPLTWDIIRDEAIIVDRPINRNGVQDANAVD